MRVVFVFGMVSSGTASITEKKTNANSVEALVFASIGGFGTSAESVVVQVFALTSDCDQNARLVEVVPFVNMTK